MIQTSVGRAGGWGQTGGGGRPAPSLTPPTPGAHHRRRRRPSSASPLGEWGKTAEKGLYVDYLPPLIGAVAERWSVSIAFFVWGAGGLATLAVLMGARHRLKRRRSALASAP